jgi:hypothetical protein
LEKYEKKESKILFSLIPCEANAGFAKERQQHAKALPATVTYVL